MGMLSCASLLFERLRNGTDGVEREVGDGEVKLLEGEETVDAVFATASDLAVSWLFAVPDWAVLKKDVKWLGSTSGETGEKSIDDASVTVPVESADDLVPTESPDELSDADEEAAEAFLSATTSKEAISGAL